jgi:hypothetical protein
MVETNWKYPEYRKLATNRTFYKILDDRNFEEKQIIGDSVAFYKIQAQQYPEILRIQDMLTLHEGFFLPSNEAEWEAIKLK